MSAKAPQPLETAAVPVPARPASPSVPDFGSGSEGQKRMLLTKLRVQSGDVPEQLISFEQRPGPIGHAPCAGLERGPEPIRGVPWRATMENEIAQQFNWCVRSKPTEKCEQARARALARLNEAGAVGSGSQPAVPARVSGALQS